MKYLSTFLLVACFALSGLQAQQIFVLYEQGCMQRVQYEQAIARQPKMDYFAYQVPLSDGNKLILETGVEGNVRQNYLPSDYLRCNDPRLNAELIDDLNGNRTKVFMLIPDGTDYLIQPVTMGAVMARQNNLITYVSPLASFQFDLRNVIIGENLAYNNPNAKVFFEGRETTDCQGKYLVRQLMARNAYPVIDYKIHPAVGVLERRLGSDGETTIGGVAVMRYINGQPIDTYLAGLCGGAPVVANTPPATGPVTYGNESVQPVNPYTGNANVPTVNPSAPAPAPVPTSPATSPTSEVETHTVAKGETLWGLSKRYGVNVNQVKEWNNLASNSITVGQVLRVGAPGMMNGTATAATQPRNPNVPTTAPTVTDQNYYPTDGGVTTQQSAATPSEREHIVQSGETVASVALQYGYTEAKFREINGLGSNEFIRIGQRLKTNSCNCPAAAAVVNNTTQPAPSPYGSGVVSPKAYTQPSATQQMGTPVGPTAGTYRAPANYQAPTQNYNNYQQPQSQPQGYGTPVTTPQSYGSQPTTPQSYGNQPASPQSYGTPATTPQTYNYQPQTTPATQSNLSITNDTGFGVRGGTTPNGYGQPAAQSMTTLEGGRPVIGSQANRPATYGQPVTSGSAPATTRAFHMVQENESLYQIAQRYGLSVDQLRAYNGLSTTDVIIPFQRLYIN